MPLSEEALPIGVRTASMTTACRMLFLRSRLNHRSRIKQFVRFGHVDQQRTRLEPLAERGVLSGPVNQLARAGRVTPLENAAAERREADAQNQPHVDMRRLADDALFQSADAFEQHGEEQ